FHLRRVRRRSGLSRRAGAAGHLYIPDRSRPVHRHQEPEYLPATGGRQSEPDVLHLRIHQYRHGRRSAAGSWRAVATNQLWRHIHSCHAVRVRRIDVDPHPPETACDMTRTLALVLLLAATAVCTATANDGTYAHHPSAQALVDRLQQRGFDPARVRALLADAANKPAIIDAMRRPAESTLTWKQYRPIFLDNKRIVRGAAFIERYQSIFDDVERQYGVPAHVIAAIIGVETRYGRITGKYRVLDALATLAFDYIPRAEFFTSELTHFVRLCLEENLDCRTERGSYAGAMGWPQFMPSSYRNYAVDFNDNGSRDLWNEPGDIIASVANYLARNGWRDGERVALPATVSDGAALAAVPRSRI